MSDQSTVEPADEHKSVELTDSEKLKAVLVKAREEKINEFVVKESLTAKDFCGMKEKAASAGVSADELIIALEVRQGELKKSQSDLAKQSLRKVVSSLGGRDIDEEVSKVDHLIDSRGDCDRPADQETMIERAGENPGRRVLAK